MEFPKFLFSTDLMRSLFDGELEPTDALINGALEEDSDRYIFADWANSHMDLVNSRRCLRALLNRVREISFENDYGDDAIALQAFSVANGTFGAIAYIKSLWFNEEKGAQSLATVIGDEEVVPSIEGQDFLHIRDCSQEKRLAVLCGSACLNSVPPFMRLDERTAGLTVGILEPLIKTGLGLDTEDYIGCSKEMYEARVGALRRLVQSSSKEEEKASLYQLLAQNERQEERLLLQYASAAERKELSNALDHEAIPDIALQIKEGLWMPLLKTYGKDAKFSYVLIAAYCRRHISLDDLATAMLFHRAYYNAPDSVRILRLNEANLDLIEEGRGSYDDSQWIEFAGKVAANQRCFIAVDYEAFDHYTQQVVESSFFNPNVIPGVFRLFIAKQKMMYGLVSFGLAKVIYPSLMPVLHLTPSLSHMSFHVSKGLSDFALFLADEEVLIHGSTDKILFGGMHDLLHARGRKQRCAIHGHVMAIAERLQRQVLPRLAGYESKLDQGVEQLHPRFAVEPTQDELVSLVIHRLCGELVDGGYGVQESASESLAQRAVQVVKATTQSLLIRTVPGVSRRWPNRELSLVVIKVKVNDILDLHLNASFDN